MLSKWGTHTFPLSFLATLMPRGIWNVCAHLSQIWPPSSMHCIKRQSPTILLTEIYCLYSGDPRTCSPFTVNIIENFDWLILMSFKLGTPSHINYHCTGILATFLKISLSFCLISSWISYRQENLSQLPKVNMFPYCLLFQNWLLLVIVIS